MISSNLSTTIIESSAQIDFVHNLSCDGQFLTAKNSALPIGVQVTPFFNTYQNYFLFLVSAIIPALLQILISIAIIASMSKTFKQNKEKEFFKGSVFASLIGKTLAYTIAYLAWGALFIFYMYGYETWEFQGSF